MSGRPERVLYETHMHTPLCKHSRGEPEEYAARAEARGLAGITITCHCPLPEGHSPAIRMSDDEFPLYLGMVERTRKEWEGRVDIRLGLECDYYPGIEPWLHPLAQRAPYDYLLGSVHQHVAAYKKDYFNGDWFAFQQTYFKHLAEAAELGIFDAISHPDLVKNEAPEEWKLERIMPYIRQALDRIAATGVAMEINTSGLNKTLPEMNPGAEILVEIQRRGIPMVIGADAHSPVRVADRFEIALDNLAVAGFEKVSFFLDRTRQDVSIPMARKSLVAVK